MTACLLVLDGAEETEKVDQHDAVSELRFVVEPVDLSPVLWNSGEGENVVKIEAESLVDVVDEGLNILLGTLVEGNNGQSGTLAAEPLEDALVVLDRRPAVAGGGDDDVSAAGKKTFQNLNTNGALPDTGEQRVLVLERGTRRSDLVKDVEVHSSEVAAVLPVRPNLTLEVQERNPVRRDRRDARDLRTKELRRRATAAGTSVTSARLRALAERTNDALVESLNATLLLLTDLRL